MAWPDKGTGWSGEEMALLKELWADDSLSASVIAQRIGRDRNGVIGKAHRIGLPSRGSPIKRSSDGLSQSPKAIQARQRRKAVRINRKRVLPAKPKPAPRVSIANEERTRVARTAYPAPEGWRGRTCQWPLWDDQERPTHEYCGGKAVPGRPYCAGHEAIAYRRVGEAA